MSHLKKARTVHLNPLVHDAVRREVFELTSGGENTNMQRRINDVLAAHYGIAVVYKDKKKKK